MSTLLVAAVTFALGCYAVASLLVLWRLLRGPRAQDRVFAIDLLYFHAILVVLSLGVRHQSEDYVEAALVIAVLGFVSTAAMAKFILRGEVIE